MSMEKLKCPTCEHYRLCSIGGLTDNRARTCKAYHMSKVPIPSAPRPIYSPVDHYDVDVETGTVTYRVVRTNGDRIRSMCDEDLALFLETTTEHGRVSEAEWMTWLKGKAQI